ncbi:Uncharacterized protein FWK35_00022064, partial [Aphis craccivora]
MIAADEIIGPPIHIIRTAKGISTISNHYEKLNLRMDEREIASTLEDEDDEIMNAFFDEWSRILLHSQVVLNDEGSTLSATYFQNEFIIMDISQSNNANNEILIIDEVKPEEVELRSLLSQWNLEVLTDVCIAHYNKSFQWRESIRIPMSPVHQDFQGPSSSSVSSHGSHTNTPSRFSPYQKYQRSTAYQRSTPSPDNSSTIRRVNNILSLSRDGTVFLISSPLFHRTPLSPSTIYCVTFALVFLLPLLQRRRSERIVDHYEKLNLRMDEREIASTLEDEDDEIMNAFFDERSRILLHSQVVLNDEGSTLSTTNSQNEFIIMDISQSNNADTEILITDEVKPDEVELRSLLSQWNLEVLTDVCIVAHYNTQRVFVNILKIIKRHHIARLLKGFDLGTQILFENKLEEWRESIGISMSPVYQDFQGTSSSSVSSHGSHTNTPSRFSPYQKDKRSTAYQRSTPSPDNSSTIVLSDILNETSRGKGLVNFYNKFSNFHEDQRSVLISLIAQYYEEKGVKMSLAASYQLEQQILERFPSEKLNCKERQALQQFSRHLKQFEPEIDAESCLKALKFDNLSSSEFDYTWKACSQFRLKYIKNNTTKDLMEKWPFYKQ